MTQQTLVRRLAPLALVSFALASACAGPPESSSPGDPGSPPSSRAAPPPPQTTSTSQPSPAAAPATGRAWMEPEIARLTRTRPDLARALRDLQPSRTRGGLLRFVDASTAEPGAAAVLLDRLLSRRDPAAVRRALAEVLPEIGCPCGDVLVDALDAEPAAEVRKAILETLEYAPLDVAERGLHKGLSDRDPAVRVTAAFLIPFRQGGAAAGPALAPTLRAALLLALDDPDPSVQDEAARAAGILRLAEAAPRLEARLLSPRADSRLHGLRALHRIDPARTRGLKALSRLKADPDPRVAGLATSVAEEKP